MKKRIFLTLTSVVFMLSLVFFCGGSTTYAAKNTYGLEFPTQQQIIDRFNKLNIDFTKSVTYSENYSTTAPYAAGDISAADRQNALNALNFVRFVAGLPDDVKLKDDYNAFTQAASLVNAVNGSLSHEPVKPSGMADDLYNLGKQGAGSSNIAMGHANIVHTILSYMEDSDSLNIDCVGHRRWILNPEMQYTGFGFVNKSSALYAIDRDRAATFTGDYVAWPPQNMPMELYDASIYFPRYAKTSNYAFSVTLGDGYDRPDLSNVKVTVTSKKKNKTWQLDKNSTNISEYLTVENSFYGSPKCIIFNVGVFEVGDTVSVEINGIYKNGVEAPISYDVNFFSIGHQHSFTSEITQQATCSREGIRTYTCTTCGEKKTETIPKTSHKYTSTITKAATCTENGVKTFTCQNCGDSYTEQIKAEGHKYSTAWTTDQAATCTQEGSKSHHCTVCGAKGSITAIPKTQHTFGAYVVKQQPTTSSEGIEERTCSSCGTKETRAIAKLSSSSSQPSSSSSVGSSSKSSSSSSVGSSNKPSSSSSVGSSGKSSSSSSVVSSSSSSLSSGSSSSNNASSGGAVIGGSSSSSSAGSSSAVGSSATGSSAGSSSAVGSSATGSSESDSSSSSSESYSSSSSFASSSSSSSTSSSTSSSEPTASSGQNISGSSDSSNSSGGSDSNVPLIVGVSISGVVLVGGVTTIILWARKKKK